MEVDLGRRPAEEGQVTEGHKELMEMGRPKSLPYKGPEVVMERSIEARAPDRGLGVSGELEREMIGSQMGSRSPAVNLTEFTNEALLEDPSIQINLLVLCFLWGNGKYLFLLLLLVEMGKV